MTTHQPESTSPTFKYPPVGPGIFPVPPTILASSGFHQDVRVSPANLSHDEEIKLYESLVFLRPQHLEKYLAIHDTEITTAESIDKNITDKEGYYVIHDKESDKYVCFNIIQYAIALGNTTLLDFIVAQLFAKKNGNNRELVDKYFLSGVKPGESVPYRTLTYFAVVADQVASLRWLKKNKVLEPLVKRKFAKTGKEYLPLHLAAMDCQLECFRFFVEELGDENEGSTTTTTSTTKQNIKPFQLTDENPNLYVELPSSSTEVASVIHAIANFPIKTEKDVEKQTALLRYVLENSPKGNNRYEKFSTCALTAFARACTNNSAGTVVSNGNDNEQLHQTKIEKFLAPVKLLVDYGLHEANLREASIIQKLRFNKMPPEELSEVIKFLAASSASAKQLEMEGINRDAQLLYLKFECLPICHESFFGNGKKVPTVPVVTTKSQGNNKSANDNNDEAPLVIAVEKRQQQLSSAVLVTLIKQRSKENAPVHIAASTFNTPLLRFLLTDRAGFSIDVNGKTQKVEVTPLILAVRGCENNSPRHLETIKCLVEEGHADLDVSQKDGATPLYVASYFNKLSAARYLLEKKANGSKMFNERATPFIGAIAAKNLDMIKLLIEMNCDTTTKRMGETPLEYSRKVNGANHPVTLFICQNA